MQPPSQAFFGPGDPILGVIFNLKGRGACGHPPIASQGFGDPIPWGLVYLIREGDIQPSSLSFKWAPGPHSRGANLVILGMGRVASSSGQSWPPGSHPRGLLFYGRARGPTPQASFGPRDPIVRGLFCLFGEGSIQPPIPAILGPRDPIPGVIFI